MVSPDVREQVRQRANFTCEFCGIDETDAGGELTIDHFRPKRRGGDESLDNLLYACPRCNQYKLDYWPEGPDDPQLWNPRREPASQHFLELEDGTLHPLTPTGGFTLRRLRLNRPPLVAHRLRKREQAEVTRLLTRYRDLVSVIEQLLIQQSALMEEQQQLLEEQQRLLQLLLGSKE
ncbi:MAG: HNH endonuclease [Anaerolineae bacterium]